MKSRPSQRQKIDGKLDGKLDKTNQRAGGSARPGDTKRAAPSPPETERKLDDIGKNIARLRSKLAKLAAARARETRKTPRQS